MAFEHLADLAADGEHRVQAGRRFLEDHRHASAAIRAHLGFRARQQFLAVELHGTADDAPGRRQQAHQPLRGGRLAAAGLAKQGKGLAALDGKRDAVDGE